jgi:hypothetical protein
MQAAIKILLYTFCLLNIIYRQQNTSYYLCQPKAIEVKDKLAEQTRQGLEGRRSRCWG